MTDPCDTGDVVAWAPTQPDPDPQEVTSPDDSNYVEPAENVAPVDDDAAWGGGE